MPTPLPAKNILDGSAVPAPVTSAMKTAMGNLRDFLAGLLGTTGDAADARTALVVPSKGEIQGQAYTAFTTSGTATAYVLTPTPAISALAENQEFDVEFHAAAGATPTLAVSGKAATALKYRDFTGALQAITAVQVPIGWRSRVVYDGTYYIVREVANVAASGPNADITSASALATISAAAGLTVSGAGGLTANNGASGTTNVGPSGSGQSRIYSDSTGGYFGTVDAIPMYFRTGNTVRAQMDSNGFLITYAMGQGYGAGAGGTVVQATSKSTAVPLHKPSGQITMNGAPLAAGATVTFQLNNSLISGSDQVAVSFYDSVVGGESYTVWASNYRTGNCQIHVKNETAGSLSNALVINMELKKGASA